MLQSVLTFIKDKVLIVAFAVLCTVALMKACNHPNTNRFQGDPLKIVPTTEYLKNGVVHEVIKVKEVSPEEMKYITDSLRRNIKGKPEIREVIKTVTRVDTVFKDLPVVIHGDTVETSKIDSYVTAKAIINTRLNKGTIELALTDTLTETRTFKNHFLGANTQTIDITNKNPYVKIKAGSAIVVKEPKPILTFGPSILVNPVSGRVQWGIGVTFNVLSIKTRK